jgi:hypothetical protein
MSTTWKQLVAGSALIGTPDGLYTVPGSTYATIQNASASNPTAGVIVVQVYLVPSGGAVGDAFRVANRSVPANSVVNLYELVNAKLAPGGQIYAMGVGNGAFLNISGAEYIPNS